MNVTNPTDPGILFGGTWEKIPYRYLVGEGIIEKNTYNGYGSVDDYAGVWGIGPGMTFGEIEHTLNINEMPSHTHGLYGANSGNTFPITNYGNDWQQTTKGWTRDSIAYTGGSQPHNNIPPSLSVYMWQRIA